MASFSYTITDHETEGYVTVAAKGLISLEDLKTMYNAIHMNPQYKTSKNRLWDFSELDVSGLTSDELQMFVTHIVENRLADTAYASVLVTRQLEFGMVRVFEALSDGLVSPNLRITKDRCAAVKWVAR